MRGVLDISPANFEMMYYFALRVSLPALSAPRAARCCVWPHSRLLADCSGSTQQQQQQQQCAGAGPHSKQQQRGHRNNSTAGPRSTAPRTPPTLNFPEPGLVRGDS